MSKRRISAIAIGATALLGLASGGTTRQYAVDCAYSIDRVQVEMK